MATNKSTTEKHKEVRAWLQCKFAGETIPPYEIREEIVEELYRLMKRNEAKDSEIQLVIDDLRQATSEYKAEAQREGRILNQVGFTPAALSQSGVTSLQTLNGVANALKLRDTSDTSYLLGLAELSDETFKVAEARKNTQHLTHQLQKKTKAVNIRENERKQELSTLDEQAAQQESEFKTKAKEVGFLQMKAKQYSSSLDKTKAVLGQRGLQPSLFHRELVKKAEEIQKVEDKLIPMRAKLKTYNSLPPDLMLTKAKIETLKKDLDELQAELMEGIEELHL
ncbi:HAUS augmin-like complex subunit 1 [Liolophura sinensis]|uniref:HAUS augmin-like complex subunit 1 n=1 Tax=Liolophura sinensis TaxID=3198878 RepID=UPI003158FCE8